jgi:uncharacterized membrane protein
MHTHLVSIRRTHPWLGLVVTDSFRVPRSTVQYHQAICKRRLAQGFIISYLITRL